MGSENPNIIENFVSALEEELISARKKSSEESISLDNGERTTSTSDKTIYTFFIEEDLKATRLKDDTPVTLVVNDEETYATIVSIGDKKIVVSTDKDYGKRLPIAQIKFDRTKPNGVPRKLLDVSLAKKYGWKAKTDLETGFWKTYQNFINNYNRK